MLFNPVQSLKFLMERRKIPHVVGSVTEIAKNDDCTFMADKYMSCDKPYLEFAFVKSKVKQKGKACDQIILRPSNNRKFIDFLTSSKVGDELAVRCDCMCEIVYCVNDGEDIFIEIYRNYSKKPKEWSSEFFLPISEMRKAGENLRRLLEYE